MMGVESKRRWRHNAISGLGSYYIESLRADKRLGQCLRLSIILSFLVRDVYMDEAPIHDIY